VGPAEFKPLLHTWSLGMEEQFNSAIALSLLLRRLVGARLVVPFYVLVYPASFVLAVLLVCCPGDS